VIAHDPHADIIGSAFDERVAPGTYLFRDFFCNIPVLVGELVAEIPFQQRQITMFGKTSDVPRLTAWFGDRPYTYSGITEPAAPMPPLVARIGRQAQSAFGHTFDGCLANLYRVGLDNVGWHSDDEESIEGAWIASASFGGERIFSVKPRVGGHAWDIPVRDRDLILMSVASQRDYLHRIRPTMKPVESRVNLTFRLMAP
jgi:alkylated DNA repair dioxygenase AlkB